MGGLNSMKNFYRGGMDGDSAPERIDPNDYPDFAFNVRQSGTSAGEDGYTTNIESNYAPDQTLPTGLNKGIGLAGFETKRVVIKFGYNSSGNSQITMEDYDTNEVEVLFTNLTDSGGESILPLDPDYYVECKLVNNTYLIWADGKNEVGYTNLDKLRSGAYGTLLQEDLTLIKPQNLVPITGVYASDIGRAANFVKGKLFQATSQYENDEFNLSTWATWSKRIIPEEESTPDVGTDVTQNNCIIWSVDIGNKRATTINIAVRYGTNIYNGIKSVERDYVLALPETDVDIDNQILEAYDPATNLYSFVFYNESVNIPVPPTQTDQLYDYLWIANAIEVINGNIIAIGDLQVGYARPTTGVSLGATGYDPGLTVPTTSLTNRVRVGYSHTTYKYLGGVFINGATIDIHYSGVPVTGDIITITTQDIYDATSIQTFTYTVLSGDAGDLYTVIQHLAAGIPNSSVRNNPSTSEVFLTFVNGRSGPHVNKLTGTPITLYNPGATVSKSIHGVLDNSTYQLALAYYDVWGRPFPLCTDNTFVVQTPSFAQLGGFTPRISWQIITELAPVGAVRYQWVITKNQTVLQGALLDVLGNFLAYQGQWNSATNSPLLAAGTGTVGDTYQISVPNGNTNFDLGNGFVNYPSGWFVVYNGKSWDLVDKAFGDLTTFDAAMYIKINPLALFNQLYTNSGFDTVLSYDFSVGDRMTLHYYIDTDNQYVNNPCIDVTVLGYDPTTYILKIEKSAALVFTSSPFHVAYNGTDIDGKDLFIRVYSPNTSQDTTTVINQATSILYEIGESYTITNGVHDVLNGFITDGDVYFKTRQYQGAVDQNTAYGTLATDFNFSDFYASEFTSYGRPRNYFDVLEGTERKASIITSQSYILGSRVNGLNRFYQENLYGDADGQSSSNYGAIQILWQRNDVLVIIQELKVGYIPVNISIIEDQAELKQVAISEKLLNNIRYSSSGNIGIGRNKESFCFYNNNGFFIDPNRSEPIMIEIDRVLPIPGKMQKFFKTTLQAAVGNGFKIIGYYDTFNNEYVVSIALVGNTLLAFPFSLANWYPFDSYVVTAADIVSLTDDANFTATFDGDGVGTFSPDPAFVGNDTSVYTFNPGTGNVSKNVCLNWTAGDGTPFDFFFTPQTGQPLSTLIYSNFVGISGIDITVAVTITGGEYNKNGTGWTSAAGTAVNGDNFQVRQTSSGSTSTLTTATLTVGGVSGAFDVTTMASASIVLFAANGLYPNSNLQVHIDDGAGHVYDIINLHTGNNTSQVIVAGTYSVTLEYNAPHGPATSPFDINGSSGVLTNNVPLVLGGKVAPIYINLNLV